MKDQKLAKAQLLSEITALRQKLEDLEKSQIAQKPSVSMEKPSEETYRILYEKLRKSFGVTINVLVSAIEMRDPYTAAH
ncbi:MAG: hypothetical protein ACLQBQ_06970 [Smithella sp.]